METERCFRLRATCVGGVLERARLARPLANIRSPLCRELERDLERDLFVDVVETELTETTERERERDRDRAWGLFDRPRLPDSAAGSAFRFASASASR